VSSKAWEVQLYRTFGIIIYLTYLMAIEAGVYYTIIE